MAYAVPDIAAENLEQYCMEFYCEWIWNDSRAKKYRSPQGVCYTEADFIEYLNRWVFPEEQAIFIENLGPIGGGKLPNTAQYSKCPISNFWFVE